MLQTIINQSSNVRQTEEIVRKFSGEKTEVKPSPKPIEPELKSIENQLMQSFGTRVSVHPGKNGGTIHIRYYSDEDLNDLVTRFSR